MNVLYSDCEMYGTLKMTLHANQTYPRGICCSYYSKLSRKERKNGQLISEQVQKAKVRLLGIKKNLIDF